jgi:ABC-type uncharacterized transport system fused permease/ATPase subunit
MLLVLDEATSALDGETEANISDAVHALRGSTTVVMIADLSLLIIMAVGLLVVDPVTAIGTLIIFSIIGFFLYKFMHVRAKDLGRLSSIMPLKVARKLWRY